MTKAFIKNGFFDASLVHGLKATISTKESTWRWLYFWESDSGISTTTNSQFYFGPSEDRHQVVLFVRNWSKSKLSFIPNKVTWRKPIEYQVLFKRHLGDFNQISQSLKCRFYLFCHISCWKRFPPNLYMTDTIEKLSGWENPIEVSSFYLSCGGNSLKQRLFNYRF